MYFKPCSNLIGFAFGFESGNKMEKKIPLLSYGPWPQAAQLRPAPSPPSGPFFFFLRTARSSPGRPSSRAARSEAAQLRGPATSAPSLPLPPTDQWVLFVSSSSYLVSNTDSSAAGRVHPAHVSRHLPCLPRF